MKNNKLVYGLTEDDLPFWYRVKIFATFWLITIPIALVVLPMTLLAILNPFWFREASLRGLQNFVNTCATKRSNMMRPMLQKYKIFDTLKNYNSNNVAGQATASKNP